MNIKTNEQTVVEITAQAWINLVMHTKRTWLFLKTYSTFTVLFANTDTKKVKVLSRSPDKKWNEMTTRILRHYNDNYRGKDK